MFLIVKYDKTEPKKRVKSRGQPLYFTHPFLHIIEAVYVNFYRLSLLYISNAISQEAA